MEVSYFQMLQIDVPFYLKHIRKLLFNVILTNEKTRK